MNREKLIKLKEVIKYVLIIFLVIYLIFIAYQKIIKKSTPAIFNKYYILQVGSKSMESTLKKGDYILVKKSNTYKEGDIVTYKEKSSFITHRIVKINENSIVTKGDNNNIEDAPIKKNDIIGKYTLKLRIIGLFLKHKIVTILILLALIIYCRRK